MLLAVEEETQKAMWLVHADCSVLRLFSSKRHMPRKKFKNLTSLPHMWTLDQGQTQQGDWTLST
jgi:hypothetical protein